MQIMHILSSCHK